MIAEQIEEEKETKPSVKNVFKNGSFAKLWLAQFVSNLGSNITLIVLPLFIFQYTGSTLWLGVITLAELIPVLLFSPFAGVFVDTHNRKKIMISSDLLNAIFISLVPVIILFDKQYPELYILGGITVIVFLQGTANRFFMPARSASIPRLVEPDEIGIAVSISQTTYQLIFVLGPILGGIIATFIGYQFAFLVDASTFLFSAIVLSLIKTDLSPLEKKGTRPSILLGTKKMFQIPSLRFIIITFSFLIFANASINSFLVAFVKTDLNMTDIQYGTTLTILGGSGILAGIIMTNKIASVKKPIKLTTIGFLLSGIFFFPILYVTQAWQLYVLFFFAGIFNIAINIPVNTIFMRDTTDDIRGQVFSALNMAISLFSILGIFYGVILAPLIGLRILFFLNSIIFIVVALIGLFYLIFIKDLDKAQLEINKKELNIKTTPEPII